MTENPGGYRPVTPDPVHQLCTHIIKGTAALEERVVRDHDVLVKLVSQMRSMGCVIVFVTGVWDLFHIGHAEYLLKGKQQAQQKYPDADHVVMIVGVDSDELTRQRKGPKRPIVPEEERYHVLAHLRAVDIITPQYEANQLYRLIEHDVRVISTSTADLPDDHEDIKRQCAHLINLPPQAETSTSARIRHLSIDGGHEVLTRFRSGVDTLIKEVEDGLTIT